MLIVAAVAATATTTLCSQLAGQSAKGGQEEATAIQEGVMSDRQKAHSRLYKGLKNAAGGRQIRDLVAERGDVEIIEVIGDQQRPRYRNIYKYLTTISCKADAVVIGAVRNKTSQIIEEGTFTFTDYEFVLEGVIKDVPAATAKSNDVITVTRPGGDGQT
jgi:hypothetical protein